MMSDVENELAHLAHDAKLHTIYLADSVERERARPFMLLRPRLFIDGNEWCALYGSNLHDGVAGFGKSPDLASRAFDEAWLRKLEDE